MIERPINAAAAFLSRPVGFACVNGLVFAGLAAACLTDFSDAFMIAYNLGLSVLAIVMSCVLLVSQDRDTMAIHVKLDVLLLAAETDNDAVGLEHRDKAEIEAERTRREQRA